MKNKNVIANFLNSQSAKTKNLKSDGTTLTSYNTAIATYLPEKNGIVLNTSKYSSSTSRIQSELKSQLEMTDLHIIEINSLQFNSDRDELLNTAYSKISELVA